MKRTTIIAVLAALSVAGTGAALAQGMGERMMRGGAMMDFDTFDADGDGRITQAELEAWGAARFDAMDADGDGQVSRAEFMDHAAAQASERAGLMFDRMDADGDGMLGRDAIAARRGGFDAGRMIRRLDTDGDGAISEAEWEAAGDRMRARMGEGRHRHGGHGERDG